MSAEAKTHNESMAQRLRRLRERAGLSVIETARRLNVPPSTYREWEYGREIRGEPYARISEVFGVTLQALLLGQSEGVGTDALLQTIGRLESNLAELRSQVERYVVYRQP